jgi:hypothetical protein
VLFGELEHLKIKTRIIDEMFASVMVEYVFLEVIGAPSILRKFPEEPFLEFFCFCFLPFQDKGIRIVLAWRKGAECDNEVVGCQLSDRACVSCTSSSVLLCWDGEQR